MSARRRAPNMPLRETEAIVLRTYRLGEADKIVSLFTRQFGRLKAVAAGAQRPKSRYGGTLEPLSYIRLWLFERENRDLLRLNSAELLESFFQIQSDYRVQIAAQYLAEASERLLPERELNERAFRLILAVLRGLKRSREIERPMLYFNYWLLRLGGFLPDLERCASCGRVFAGEAACRNGTEGLVCLECGGTPSTARNGEARNDSLKPPARLQDSSGLDFWPALSGKVSARTRALGQTCRTKPLDRWLDSEKRPEGLIEALSFFEGLVEIQAEKKLVTRALLDEALAET
jgi:DNA repair protein RecO (recombination protein O)